jgi:hypothetical protein
MAKIWIKEEEVSEKLIDELDHFISFDGKIQKAYYINASTDGGDYVEENQQFLRDFLISQYKFPLYLTFILYDDQVEEYQDMLKRNSLDFTQFYLEENRSYFDITGRHKYHPPCFLVKIYDSKSISLLLDQTFWLPAQNEFYSISYSDNLNFKLEKVKEWGRKTDRSVPIFKAENDTTFITIYHDGAGFYLFSNEEKYSSIEKLSASLPQGTIITQINDQLLD